MIVLGIDPGSHRTGWGVVQVNGNRLLHVASGVVYGDSEHLPTRLANLADGLDAMLGKHRPDVLSIESIFHAKNSQSALQLGHARGIAVLCAVRAGLSVFEYTAGQIKQATTGRGRAEKEQVQAMVRMILGLGASVELVLDQSDALAAAICHAQIHGSTTGGKWQAAIAEAKRAAK